MTEYRQETDLLGQCDVPTDALYGIATQRAVENFPLTGRRIHPALIHAYGAVKLACARTNHDLGRWNDTTFAAIEAACLDMHQGRLDDHILVDALQGGAGTSTNMNVNEVLTNRALGLLGHRPGDYEHLDPLADLNLHQSTNDTYPTALKVAAIGLLESLEHSVVALQEAFQAKEKAFADVVKVGRTQMQDAVLTTLGREMGAYADALSRDRWRLYKCIERLRVVNLGGTAIGTGLAAPRQYIFRVVDQLRAITGLGLARAENLVDATQNADVFVEVSGICKALATTLMKIANDLRLMASGPEGGFGEIRLPARQPGSTIMPGKVNPVIPEAVWQAGVAVCAHDQAIAHAVAAGSLELNPFLPLVADALLDSLTLLANACTILRHRCVDAIEADRDRCRQHVENSTATVTALVEAIGYKAAQDVAHTAQSEHRTIRNVVVTKGLMTDEQFDQAISPARVMRLGSPPPPE